MTRTHGVWWHVMQIKCTAASGQLQEVPTSDHTCTQAKEENSPAPGALHPHHTPHLEPRELRQMITHLERRCS